MPKIKLLRVYDRSMSCEYCEHYVKDFFAEELSDWQEVTDEELTWLRSWQGGQVLKKEKVVVVILEDITSQEKVAGFVSDIKKFIKDEENRIEQIEKRRLEAEKKRKITAEKKKIERAKKLLEKSGIKIGEK